MEGREPAGGVRDARNRPAPPPPRHLLPTVQGLSLYANLTAASGEIVDVRRNI